MASHLETADLHRMAPIRCLLDNDRSYGGRERTRETGRASSRPSGVRPVAGIPTSRQPGCATTHRARRRRHGPLLGVLPRRAGRPCEVAVPAGDGSAARRGTPGPMTPEARHRMRGFGLVAIGVVMVPYRVEPGRGGNEPSRPRSELWSRNSTIAILARRLPGNAGYPDHQMPDGRCAGRRNAAARLVEASCWRRHVAGRGFPALTPEPPPIPRSPSLSAMRPTSAARSCPTTGPTQGEVFHLPLNASHLQGWEEESQVRRT